MPSMYAMYVHSVLRKRGCDVIYSREMNNKEIEQTDYIILPSSIICHETEIESLKKLSEKGKKIFVIGIFANVIKSKYQTENSYIVQGEPEAFFSKINLNKEEIDNFFSSSEKNQITAVNQLVENLDELPFPNWDYYSKKYPLKIIF